MFQAGVYGVLSILGMAWWAGQIGVRREALALVVMSGGAWLGLVFLITGDVPHLGAWMPFGMMAAGFALAGTFRAVDDLRGYLHPLEIILGVLALLVWLPVPFADWLSVPQDIALIWLCVRGVLALIIMWRMVRLWKEAAEVVRMWPPLLWVFGVIGVSTAILFV
jgi:hypothetical protein